MSQQQKVASPEMQQFIMQQQAKAQLQQTISRLTEECWGKCIGTPGNYMTGKEQACMDNCARRFLESTQFVVKYFQAKANQGGQHSDF
ncbi:mitochondrial inner membrane translocase isoform A [Chlorella sorokiniana]|uniref:Mitochondrial import inner membrane translocase subunit n=1 Tax=Chlorella sorokiniana TaxID=3076 RepID=A0A2P6TIY8_CHLSO|nr:mitochondrial inner membrane translocase isoform B [Chlorella sorokiniana]PRW39215.1 mitochondrial inner membrane translocase isoform A [Chlorella sorokiniana]|eukprot:PRW39214.1 mitochondrial inner membrane translocase isoform B [Chlorella sorokiniana]